MFDTNLQQFFKMQKELLLREFLCFLFNLLQVRTQGHHSLLRL